MSIYIPVACSGSKRASRPLRTESYREVRTIERYTDGLVWAMQMRQVIEILSASKAPKRDGKGNSYVDLVSRHMPLLEAMQTASRKAFRRAFIG